MRVHVLEREQVVPLEPEEVFRFYTDIRNLEPMTPPWLRFRVTTDPGLQLQPGVLIQYRLTLHAVPIRWTTRIEEWDPARRFVDTQVRGPYRLWEHTHVFSPVDGGTLIEDRVRYVLPYGPLGALAHAVFVRRDLRRIFDFRRDAAARMLRAQDAPADAAYGRSP
jgi:ligand-binding SRPBCC domain-containing protein